MPLAGASVGKQRTRCLRGKMIVSAYEKDVVLKELRDLNYIVGPVIARVLAELNGWSERTTRDWLRRLEMAGLVGRPVGLRSGWMVR